MRTKADYLQAIDEFLENRYCSRQGIAWRYWLRLAQSNNRVKRGLLVWLALYLSFLLHRLIAALEAVF